MWFLYFEGHLLPRTRLQSKFQSLDFTVFALQLVRQEIEFINMETKVLQAPGGTRCNWGLV